MATKNPSEIPSLEEQMQGLRTGVALGTAGGLMDVIGNVDLGNVSEGGGRLLPVTDDNDEKIEYEWRIEKSEATMSKKDNKQLSLELTCVWPAQYKGAKAWDQCVLTENAMWKFKSLARAAGLLSQDGKSFTGNSESDFKGRIVGATVYHDEYQGKVRHKIDGGYFEPQNADVPANISSEAPNFG